MRRAALVVACALAGGCAAEVRTGMQRVQHPNGQLKWEVQTRDGVPHGTSRTFDEAGTLRSTGAYHFGRKHGLFVFYDANQNATSKTYYWRGTVVWTTTNAWQSPPPEVVVAIRRLEAKIPFEEIEREEPPSRASFPDLIGDTEPLPYFASVDRTVPLSRFGVDLGLGGSAPDEGGVQRGSVFGNYVIGPASVYAQVTGARLTTMADETQSGRATAEVSGAYHLETRYGVVSPRVGLVVPVANDNQDGFEAAAGSAYQRPTDAATAFPSTVTIRSGASWTRSARRWVAQADGGIDWAAGGAGAHVRPVGRLNLALGVGGRSLLGLLELSNAVRLDDTEQAVQALGTGAAIVVQGVWTTALIARTTDDHTTFVLGAGYGF